MGENLEKWGEIWKNGGKKKEDKKSFSLKSGEGGYLFCERSSWFKYLK